ncbi:MAG: helix-turn-helix domain-containing protein [Stellaceae bacterium]
MPHADLPPYTIEETAERLKMSTAAVRGAARRGELPAFKLGRDWRILAGPVEKLLSEDKKRAAG